MIAAHERQGHTVAIATSATRYQVEPVAKLLGVKHILCTELEVQGPKGKLSTPVPPGISFALTGADLAIERDAAKPKR